MYGNSQNVVANTITNFEYSHLDLFGIIKKVRPAKTPTNGVNLKVDTNIIKEIITKVYLVTFFLVINELDTKTNAENESIEDVEPSAPTKVLS